MTNESVSIQSKNAEDSSALGDMLLLRFEPIAIKMIKDEADVPANAIHPLRDTGKHMALCQGFSMARRSGKTFYVDKQTHWCWNPLIGLGHVDCSVGTDSFDVVSKFLGIEDEQASRNFFEKFPRFPLDTYKGIVVGPLKDCGFEPDVVLIYCNNAQLRSLLWGIKHKTGKLVETVMDAIDSCVYAIVPPMQTGDYQVTLPDIGEFERAMAEEGEIILSVPAGRMDEVISGLQFFQDRHMGYTHLERELELDYSRPPFYNMLYRLWGLDEGRDWDR